MILSYLMSSIKLSYFTNSLNSNVPNDKPFSVVLYTIFVNVLSGIVLNDYYFLVFDDMSVLFPYAVLINGYSTTFYHIPPTVLFNAISDMVPYAILFNIRSYIFFQPPKITLNQPQFTTLCSMNSYFILKRHISTAFFTNITKTFTSIVS